MPLKTAKNASLICRANCATEATSSTLPLLRKSQRQTHVLASPHQFELRRLSAVQIATGDQLLDGHSIASTTRPTAFKGLSWYITRRKEHLRG